MSNCRVPQKESNHACLQHLTVARLFEQQASRTPHATAVVYGARKLSYGDLNRRSNQVARYLRGQGLGAGMLAGIGIDRSLETIVGILGILKAGAAYVPLDPSYPKDRLAWMLADCQAPLLLTVSSARERFAGFSGATVCLDREWPSIVREPAANPEWTSHATDRIYVMYTSGSGGWPKGVQIAHRSVVNAASAMRAKVGLEASDVVLSVSSPSFDIHVLDVWMPLTCGASVVVAPAPACRDGGELAREIARAGVTVMQATPSTWQLLLYSGWTGSHRLTAVSGGETLTSELAALLGKKVKALWNAYGPTETTVWSSAYKAGGAEDIVPIGRPLANTQFHVLDECRRPVPAGVAGELYIGGEGLALGYLNLAELTSQKFIANPFDRSGVRRLYRTGDRARQRLDGNFEFLGRLDRQVKLRGHRIELDEISAVIGRHPGVREAVTTLNRNDGGYKHLAAYVVSTAENSAKPEHLRAFLRAALPDHMVPARLTFLDALPRLPNGKVDYRALSEPELSEVYSDCAVAVPKDALERSLAGIFEEVLGRGPVNTRQSFFNLGGDSMLVAKLLRRIENTTGTRLPMGIVFQAETIEQLARVLRERDGSVPRPGVIPIHAEGCGPSFLCLGAGPSFLPLARLVGGGLRFTGLDLGVIDATQLRRPYRLEDLAEQVAQRITELQPQGPFHLGGWCRYGPLAYETARQLMAQGDEIALLTLIDSENPRYYRELPVTDKLERKWQRLVYHANHVWNSKASEIPAYVGDRFKVLRYRLSHHVGRRTEAHTEELERILHAASARYDSPAYPGRTAVFQSMERPHGRHWNLALGWRPSLEGRLEVYNIPGDHETMLQEPHVQVFASHMRACLGLERYFEAEVG